MTRENSYIVGLQSKAIKTTWRFKNEKALLIDDRAPETYDQALLQFPDEIGAIIPNRQIRKRIKSAE